MRHRPDPGDPEQGIRKESRHVSDLPLWVEHHARGANPQTSFDAAESMQEIAAQQQRHLYDALVAFGPQTCDEIDQRLGWRPTTAGRRMSDLVREGLARDTGQTRPTRSGRQATIYCAIQRSEAA